MMRSAPRRHAPVLLPCLVALGLSCAPAGGNDGDAAPPQADEATMVQAPPPADPADVASVEAVVHAVYDVISGEAGEARDWDRWRSLFLPQAQLHPIAEEGEGGWTLDTHTPEEFVARADSAFTADGFYEVEIGEVTEVYGNIAHRFSSYASYRSESDPEPFNRGINSFQLLHDGERWWVLSVLWQHEFQGGDIPERYLDGP